MEILCNKCGTKLPVPNFCKPFSFKERKASTVIVDANEVVMVTYASQYGTPQMSAPNKIKAQYVLDALNAYEPPKEDDNNE